MRTDFIVDGQRQTPTLRQRVGFWLINAGGTIIKKGIPKSVSYSQASTLKNQRDAYDDLLAAIWLYIDWRYVTKQLTTEQKDLFADAVDRSNARMDADEGRDLELDPRSGVERWWQD